MECIFCKDKMQGVIGYDNPRTDLAWNLSICNQCGAICKEDIWDNKGQTWIPCDYSIKIIIIN